MALNATIFKADLQISDMDRHYYQSHGLTIARHPSETDERMMVRLLAFARHANEALVFAKGLSDTDEPDLWQKDLTGSIELWIEVGQPDEKRILKACGRSAQVVLYTYGHAADIWWKQIASRLTRLRNLTVINLDSASTQSLAALAERGMQLQCTVQDGELWLAGAQDSVQIVPSIWMSPER
jgi:uncharacterized protein YaeQ